MQERFIVVATFNAALDAQMALHDLQAAGVQAFLSGEMTASAFSGMTVLGPQLALFAAQTDRKRALDVLSVMDLPGPPGWEDAVDVGEGVWVCSLCGSPVDEHEDACPSCSTPRSAGDDADG